MKLGYMLPRRYTTNYIERKRERENRLHGHIFTCRSISAIFISVMITTLADGSNRDHSYLVYSAYILHTFQFDRIYLEYTDFRQWEYVWCEQIPRGEQKSLVRFEKKAKVICPICTKKATSDYCSPRYNGHRLFKW